MYYIPDLLKKRSGGQLARCWLAATLNESQFRKIYKRRDLLSVDIEKLCDDIKDGTVLHKFSLYLLSQLMHGVLKLQLYKTRVMEDSCKQLQAGMMSARVTKKEKRVLKKEKKIRRLPDITTDLVAPPSFSEQFRQDLEQPDCHLLIEPDYRLFGALIEAEHDDFGEREFDRINEEDLVRLERGDGLFREKTERNIDVTEEITHREESTQIPLNVINLNENVLGTPSKRARRTHADTPSKRRRKTQFDASENQENIPPAGEPMNISSIYSTTAIQSLMPNLQRPAKNLDLSKNERTVDVLEDLIAQKPDTNASTVHSTTIISDFTLEPLLIEEELPRRRIKHTKFLDFETHISNDSMKTQIANPNVMTRPITKLIVDIDRVYLDSQLLFNIPSTSARFKSKFIWAGVLLKMFSENIEGSFHVGKDETGFSESVRIRDTTAEKTAELSDDVEHRNVLIPQHRDSSVTETVTEDVHGVPLAEIPRESIDIGNIEISNPQIPESEFATTLEDQTFIAPTALEPTKKTELSSSSDDSFLPHTVKKRCAYSKTSSGDKTVDINSVASSSRSNTDSCTSLPLWTKEKLFLELKKLWDRNLQQYPITFKEVFPPGTTLKSDGICGLLDLLQLATDSKIQLQQAEPYAQLYIYLDFD